MTLKEQIRAAINNFQHDDLTLCTLKLFDTLGYNTKRQCSLPQKNSQYFIKHLTKKNNFSLKKTIIKDWKSIDLVFQLTSKELMTNSQLYRPKKFDSKIIESYLFVAIELTQNNYSRSKIAQIAREINKTFPMPTLIIFRYENKITIAITNHQTNHQTNKQNKNNTEKITLIKDIEITNIHCAHLDILCDLSLPQIRQTKQVNNFADLNNAWMQIIDTKELNKHFYKELSNWYSWAIKHVNFPNNKNQNNENHNSINLIRLITRIIFVWFIKEKHLIPEKLFDPITLKTIVKNFNKNNNSTNYYNTILQNLFFVTLNQKTNEHNCAENCNEIDAKMNYRYENLFIVKKAEIQELFKEIPFLNCGLFDCLDEKNIETNKYEYVDGFSNDVTKCALIPDFIFFGKEQRTDLNPIFETKNKKYANKGLFNILKSYKFTVAENTAIEEEIALDPELLGNVFENLLASYNPETKITTRKQTGSFYTPKEIVEYMVDESLIAYLKNYLSEHQTTTTKKQFELENKLRSLLSYETKNPFDKNETIIIIQAINNCNILDPACGSGAFPIGILHKLVLMLQKLDPKNTQWKKQQREKIINTKILELQNDKKIATTLNDNQLRKLAIKKTNYQLKELDEIFNREYNFDDYARKLFLIENCIFGIDIQSIAVQITKLRFFISLVIDQKENKKLANFGIRVLPNLTTKFVAANTLVAPNETTTNKITNWNPHNQNITADWFDPELMFGVKCGFDIVIGNPPYGADIGNFAQTFKKLYPKTSHGFKDIYKYFFDKSLSLLSKNGTLTFITPNTFLRQPRYVDLRRLILEKSILQLIDLGEHIFDAVVPTAISIISLKENENVLFADLTKYNNTKTAIQNINFKIIKKQTFKETPNNLFVENARKKMPNEFILGDILEIKDAGFKYQRSHITIKEKGNNNLADRIFYLGNKKRNNDIPILTGKNINAFQHQQNPEKKLRVNYRELLRENEKTYYNKKIMDEKTKLIWRQTAPYFIGTILNKPIFFGNTIQAGIIKNNFKKIISYEYLCGLLNSKYLRYLYEQNVKEENRAFPQVKLEKLRILPIVIPQNQQPITTLVNQIIAIKKSNPVANTSTLELQIDALVFLIYGLTEKEMITTLSSIKFINNSEQQQIQKFYKEYKK